MRRGQLEGYGFSIKADSVVKMELDLKKKELIFYVDGNCKGPAYSDIECAEDIYYKMAVIFEDGGSGAKLLEYTESDDSVR